MQPSWKERTTPEKIAFVLQAVCAAGFVISLIVNGFDGPQTAYIFIAVESALEAFVQWSHSRKIAKLSLVAAVSSLLVFFTTL